LKEIFESQFYIRNTGGHMNKFIITTDTTADLPADYVAEHNLGMLSLTYTIDGKTYDWKHPMDVKEFYAKMRAGYLPTTSQVNPETAREIFTKIATENDCDILHIAFSSRTQWQLLQYKNCCK